MRNLVITGVLAAACMLAACSKSCAGLSDKDALDRVASSYAAEPASQKGDTAQMQFAAARLKGVGHGGQGLIQLWFTQDDHTLTVATLSNDCLVQFRPGLAPDAIDQAAIATAPPKL